MIMVYQPTTSLIIELKSLTKIWVHKPIHKIVQGKSLINEKIASKLTFVPILPWVRITENIQRGGTNQLTDTRTSIMHVDGNVFRCHQN